MSNKILKHAVLFSAGGIMYVFTELLWRGYSHWSMFLLGGMCFVAVGLINEVFPWTMALWKQGVAGALLITLLELAAGCIMNLWLGWQIWDYSDMPFNFMGQICPLFSILWILVSIAAVFLDDMLRHWLFCEDMPGYTIF